MRVELRRNGRRLGPVDAVTYIFTKCGAVRGNHTHYQTTQWTWVLSGKLLIVTENELGKQTHTYLPGQMAKEDPGVSHAWRALLDTECLVFTRGPRSGENYESDTHRLEIPLI